MPRAGGLGRRRRADTRRAIVDAGAQLFSRQGFTRTSMRDIAAAVGVTEPALYRHFSSKKELLDAVFEERGIARWADWIAETRQRVSVATAIEQAAVGALRFIEQNHDLLRLVLFEALTGDSGALAHHEGMMARWHAGIRTLITHHDSSRGDSTALAETFVAYVWGIGLQRLLGTDAVALVDAQGQPTDRCKTLALRLVTLLRPDKPESPAPMQ